MSSVRFLPGVPAEHVEGRLQRADGKELQNGKFDSPESSSRLAVNVFGWFVDQPALTPPFPVMPFDNPVERVEVEYCARFPWSGGRHPWLDAAVMTPSQLIGVESKRFEPFRGAKAAEFSDAYSRSVWGSSMAPFEHMRDALRSQPKMFRHLDGAQLVKHAFGLVTEGRRKGRRPTLLYLFAEPAELEGRPIGSEAFAAHRSEIAQFSSQVAGAEVAFHSVSYREWLVTWPNVGPVAQHAAAITAEFMP